MSSKDRRRARNLGDFEDAFYHEYIKHLPRVSLDEIEPGRIYRRVYQHDDWCARYSGGLCNCNVIITRHVEPKRS
jgi:hypothetical protein